MEHQPSVVDAARQGNPAAIEQLVCTYQSMAIGYAYSLVGDYQAAEDVAQEAFIQAIRSLGKLRNSAAFPLWFKTIVRFTSIRTLRSKHFRNDSLSDHEDLPSEMNVETQCDQQEQHRHLWRAIRALPETDRSVVVLYYLHDCSHREIAHFLGLSESHINNRLHTIRKVLRRELTIMSEQSTHKQINNNFTHRVLAGVQKVAFFEGEDGMLSPSVGCLTSVMAFLGIHSHVNYPFLAATSGSAFRAVWQKGWADNNNDILILEEDPLLFYKHALDSVGCRYEMRYCESRRWWWPQYLHDRVTWSDEAQSIHDIKESIDRGMPVLALGIIGPPECSIITGYDEDGQVLLGWSFFQGGWPNDNEFSIDESGYFRKRNWWPRAHAYFIITDVQPGAADETLLFKTLRRAVTLAHNSPASPDGGIHPPAGRNPSGPLTWGSKTVIGLGAFRACADQLIGDDAGFQTIPLKPENGYSDRWDATVAMRLGSLHDFILLLKERKHAAQYLESAAAAYPQWADDLLAAAAQYRTVTGYADQLSKQLSWEDEALEKFRTPEARSVLAGLVLRARLADEQAVMRLEALLEKAAGEKAA